VHYIFTLLFTLLYLLYIVILRHITQFSYIGICAIGLDESGFCLTINFREAIILGRYWFVQWDQIFFASMTCNINKSINITALLFFYVAYTRLQEKQSLNTRKKQLHVHTYTCTHKRLWLVLGWVTTKEYHPPQRIAYMSYTWQIIKLYLHIRKGLCGLHTMCYTKGANISL